MLDAVTGRHSDVKGFSEDSKAGGDILESRLQRKAGT